MIRKVPRDDITNYELRYFYEAEVGERKNIRRITLSDAGAAAVNGNDKTDADIDTDAEDDDFPDDDLGDADTPMDIETEPEDDLDDAEMTDDVSMGDDTGDAGGDGPALEPDDEVPAEGESDTSDGDDGIQTEPDDEEAMAGDDTGNEGDSDTGNNETPDKGELLRKRALFSRLRGLHDAIRKYIEKLNMMMARSSSAVIGYREACDSFDELATEIYDYMLIRFTDASYEESMLLYQRSLAAINLILNDLEEVDLSEVESPTSKKQQFTKQGKSRKKNAVSPSTLKQDNKNKRKGVNQT